jgi:dsDNA-specific endonuclease/ATPase MutS2
MFEINHLLSKLEIITPMAQKRIRNLNFFTKEDEISSELDKIAETIEKIQNEREKIEKINAKLMYIKDISKTLESLKGDFILDDIELYEIKYFSLNYEEIRKIMTFSYLKQPSLEKVIEILDPDGKKLPTFYIYDSYSEELANIRKKKKTASENEKIELFLKEAEIEEKIRKLLTKKLKKYINSIEQAIKDIEELDFVLAKAKQALENGFTRPEISDHVNYKGLFNPVIKESLEKESKKFQPISIKLYKGVTLITGANMTGKTVLLRTLALSQYLFQYGFYVPAKSAKIKVFKKIFLISGDYQSTLKGLSSYAAEMMKLDEILKYLKEEEQVIILLDELARNTNPHEGKLIVKAVIRILNELNAVSVITTHFNNVADKNIRKLRIRGIKKEKLMSKISPENLTEIIDYSLVEEKEEIVPEEALTIAKLLNIDDKLIEEIDRLKKEGNSNE